jgi:hypothetical protein
MATSYFHDQVRPASSQHSNDRAILKQAIKNFLLEASSTPPHCELCRRCGEPLEYVETTFWLYGEHCPFRVRLPVCRCDRTVEAP